MNAPAPPAGLWDALTALGVIALVVPVAAAIVAWGRFGSWDSRWGCTVSYYDLFVVVPAIALAVSLVWIAGSVAKNLDAMVSILAAIANSASRISASNEVILDRINDELKKRSRLS